MIDGEYKYFVVNTFEKWTEGFAESIRIHDDGHITLLANECLKLPDNVGYITGFSVDRNGNIYAIDARNSRIYRYNASKYEFSLINCIGGHGYNPGQFNFAFPTGKSLGGKLTMTQSKIYITGRGNHRDQAFYLRNFQIRFITGAENSNHVPIPGSKPGEFHTPSDIVTDSRRNLYVLDIGNNQIQKFKKCGRFVRFVGKRGPEVLVHPSCMAIDKNDMLYVFDAAKKYIIIYDKYGKWQKNLQIFENVIQTFKPGTLAVDQHGIIYVGETGTGEAIKIHKFNQAGKYLGYIGKYSKRCFHLEIDDNNKLYASFAGDGELVLLNSTKHYMPQGIYYSAIFDSVINECQWHRILLDADVHEKAKINVHYAVSDSESELEDLEHVNWMHVLCSPKNSLQPKDGLFREDYGRFLRFKIELLGDEINTPVIRNIRLFFPRLSYLRYLPAIYQEDQTSKEFLERYLSIFETMSYEVEEQIASITQYFDPQATDKQLLNWLAAWLGIAVDENWSEQFKRTFIEEAFQLYKYRGTPTGLKKL
ncbi:MAG: 6-bladed beta-propeller, partial [Bacteroidales bacterium]|nr:6-bladed beta-propeller [Bacteroidales bacterium]